MRRFIRKFRKQFRHGEKGFTLIELLVVIAILGALVAIAVPSIASFIGSGETEAKQAEKYNVITAVTAALVEATVPGTLDHTYTTEKILASVSAGAGDPAEWLLNDTEYTYTITADGTTTQH